MPSDLTAGIVRVLRADGTTAGTGFVASADGLIVTCSHVVQDVGAQGRGEPPPETVGVVFLAGGEERVARVERECWLPWEQGDVAVLRLKGGLPEGVAVLPLGQSNGRAGREFRAYGFPGREVQDLRAGGGTVVDVLPRVDGSTVLQLRSPEVTQGFSGSPVWDNADQRVLGIVSQIAPPDGFDRGRETSFATPSETLLAACADLVHVPTTESVPAEVATVSAAQPILEPYWFQQRLEDAVRGVGPRYTPELHVDVPIARSFEAFGRTSLLEEAARHRTERLMQAHEKWLRSMTDVGFSDREPSFPQEAKGIADELSSTIQSLIDLGLGEQDASSLNEVTRLVAEGCAQTANCEQLLVTALEAEYGPGAADSVGFRQYHAEIEMSFPAWHVDAIRELATYLDDLVEWVQGNTAALPIAPAMLILGTAGAGKTHALCDAAVQRARRGLRSLIVLGGQFTDGEPWDQLRTLVGLAGDVSRDDLLSRLNATGESTGYPLIVFIDALNEATPRSIWRRFLAQMVEQVGRYPWVKLCLSCRTSYRDEVVPEGFDLPEIVHNGFEGVEFEALPRFFEFFEIELPSTPLLQPEYSNPLFLRIVCESLRDEGQHRFPEQDLSFDELVRLVLESKNRKISEVLDRDRRERLVNGAVDLLIGEMIRHRTRWLPWGDAKAAVDEIGPSGPRSSSLFHQMVGEGLLIEDRILETGSGTCREVVRIAFERLADYLIAMRYLNEVREDLVLDVFSPNGELHFTVQDVEAVVTHRGLLEAFAILLPERFRLELSEIPFVADLAERLNAIVCESLMWRSRQSIGQQTEATVRQALRTPKLFAAAMEGLITVATRVGHPLNAYWGNETLAQLAMPDRDAALCPYLHEAWGKRGGLDRLIRWALEADLRSVSGESVDLWATQLSWFLVAADRRVRDNATKAMVRILDHQPDRCAPLLARFVHLDDEYVIERCLAACYGALVRWGDVEALRSSCQVMLDEYFLPNRTPQNALVRDYARLIVELAVPLGLLPSNAAANRSRPPYQSDWPLEWPNQNVVASYEDQDRSYPRLYHSCMGDDFFRYTIVSTFGQYEEITPLQAGRWIFKHVMDMGYTAERFAAFDWYMVERYGPGRGRPTWAERIGKKYQWIALYRLLARVADHVEPTRASWEPEEFIIPPLQAARKRNIDPTHWLRSDSMQRAEPDWQLPSYDFAASQDCSDEKWLALDDFPESANIVQASYELQGQVWQPLSAFFEWQSRPITNRTNDDFRLIRLDVRSYLTERRQLDEVLKQLESAKLTGMYPERGCELHEAFLGEYPSAVPARVELQACLPTPDSIWHVPGLVPAENRMSIHFELDAYGEGLSASVPSVVFVERSGLRWNGSTGYILADNRLCFESPSTLHTGPFRLMVDPTYLQDFLVQNDYVVLWIVIGDKQAISDRPRGRTFLDIIQVHSFDGLNFQTIINKKLKADPQAEEA